MDFDKLLLELGVNLTSSAIVEFIKKLLDSNLGIERQELKQQLAAYINIQGDDIKAERIISFLSNSGFIVIEGSKIYSGEAILMYAGQDAKLTFGNNSVSETPRNRIDAGKGAYIEMQGEAGIKQNEDGSISFFTGNNKS
ncbi:hypothetical protein HYU93_03930 [Candidatus Daviesbacteria bacterium]|nr:hypothetical protein [Candidatus Daviesbacteria bacterium]